MLARRTARPWYFTSAKAFSRHNVPLTGSSLLQTPTVEHYSAEQLWVLFEWLSQALHSRVRFQTDLSPWNQVKLPLPSNLSPPEPGVKGRFVHHQRTSKFTHHTSNTTRCLELCSIRQCKLLLAVLLVQDYEFHAACWNENALMNSSPLTASLNPSVGER